MLLATVTLYGFSFPYTRRLSPVALASAQLTMAAPTPVPAFLLDGSNERAASLCGMGPWSR